MLVPVIPLPMITTSAVEGRALVDRCPRSNGEGSLCQKESVDFGVGRAADWSSLGRSKILRAMMYQLCVNSFVYPVKRNGETVSVARSNCSKSLGMVIYQSRVGMVSRSHSSMDGIGFVIKHRVSQAAMNHVDTAYKYGVRSPAGL